MTRSESTRSNKRVVKRPQIRVDLVLQIAGQKTEPFAGFDRRTRQDNAADLLLEQSIDRHRNCQKDLAGAGDADAENQIVVRNCVKIFALICGFWRDLFLAGRIKSCL